MNTWMKLQFFTHHVPLWEEEVSADVLEEMSKAFFQPDVLPPHRSHQITKPLKDTERKLFHVVSVRYNYILWNIHKLLQTESGGVFNRSNVQIKLNWLRHKWSFHTEETFSWSNMSQRLRCGFMSVLGRHIWDRGLDVLCKLKFEWHKLNFLHCGECLGTMLCIYCRYLWCKRLYFVKSSAAFMFSSAGQMCMF